MWKKLTAKFKRTPKRGIKRESGDSRQNLRRSALEWENPNAGKFAEDRRKQAIRAEQRLRRDMRRAQFYAYLTSHFNILATIVGTAVVVTLLVLVGIGLHSANTYVIKDITIAGNKRITPEQLNEILDPFKGQSMLLVSRREVEHKIRQRFGFVRSVSVLKILPGKLKIEISERNPVLVFVTLSGAYLLDDEYTVVGILGRLEVEGLTFEQSQIVAGFGDVSSALVQEQYLSKLSEEERQTVKWEEVKHEDKEAALNELRQVLNARLEEQLAQGKVVADASEFTSLLRAYSLSNAVWEQGDEVNPDYVDLSVGLNDYATKHPEQIVLSRIVWYSEYLIRVEMSGKILLFSSVDDLSYQLRKLEAVIQNNLLSQGNEFDLRGEKIVVR
jgi:hypothetical protein